MLRLLQIEWLKLRRYKAFWILLVVYLGFQTLLFYGMDTFKISFNGEASGPGIGLEGLSIFSHPNIWMFFSYMAGFFKIILAVLLILLLNNEFEFKTYRQHIIDGLSRFQNFMLKVILMFGFTILSFVLLVLLVWMFGTVPEGANFWDKGIFGFGLALETLGFLSFAFMLSHFIKKTGLVLGLLLVYSLGIEPYLNYKYPEVGAFLPLQVFSDFIDQPFTSTITSSGAQETIPLTDLGLGLAYVLVFLSISFIWVKKRDQ